MKDQEEIIDSVFKPDTNTFNREQVIILMEIYKNAGLADYQRRNAGQFTPPPALSEEVREVLKIVRPTIMREVDLNWLSPSILKKLDDALSLPSVKNDAVEFAEWTHKEGWQYNSVHKDWCNYGQNNKDSEELYELFKLK